MAVIKTQGMGKAAVVLLDESDRAFLYSGLQAYAVSSGISMKALASQLGVNRTYLYTLLDSNQIELSRLASIQNLVGCYLISDAAAFQYSSSTQPLISGRPVNFHWPDVCPHVHLSAFYVAMFLIPAMKREANALRGIFANVNLAGPETVLPPFTEDGFLVELITTYCSTATTLFEDAIHEDFYESSGDNLLSMSVPIAMPSSFWLDVFEIAEEAMVDYFRPTETLCEKTFESLYPPGFADTADDEMLDQMQSDRDYLRLENESLRARRQITHVVTEIDSWSGALESYCKEANRRPRRPFYFPLELKEVIADLDSNTIPILNSSLTSE